MKVNFYTPSVFSKKVNSTKVPASDAAKIEVDGQIKGDFSPLAPVIRFQETIVNGTNIFAATSVPVYRYAHIPSFERYYFVSWAFIDGAWEGSFTEDCLASWRTNIRGSTQYVERSASEQNRKLTDSAYITNTDFTCDIQSKSFSDIFGIANDLAGVYVVGVLGYTKTSYTEGGVLNEQPSNVGAVTYYAMARVAFYGFMYALMSNINWMQISTSEISEELQKALINPMQYIVSVIWLPISAGDFVFGGFPSTFPTDIEADKTHTIRFGWWDFYLGADDAATVRKLRSPTSQYTYRAPSYTFPLAQHPLKATRGEWLNLSPYTRRVLEIPCFGTFELDTTKIKTTHDQLTIQYFINALSGDAMCYVWSGTSGEGGTPKENLVLSVSGQVGIPIPTGQIAVNVANFKNALIGGAAVGALELFNQ